MLTALKHYLKLALIPVLFIGGLVLVLITILKEATWGLLFMISVIPLPNLWHKFYDFPMGKDFMDFFFVAVLIGMFIQKKGFAKTDNSGLIIAFIIISYLSLWNSSIRFSLPLPITTSNTLLYDWKNYAMMIFMYFLVLNVIKNEDQQKVLVVIMSLVVLFIAIRSIRNFSAGELFNWDKRCEGPFWSVGLNANHFGAFISYCWAFFLGLFLLDKNRWRKWLFLMTVLFCLHPIFFSYSRGAYISAFSALTFFGIIKKRSLLILAVAILFAWQTLLPASVVDRIEMTRTEEGQLEHSASGRIDLWKLAIDLFKKNLIFGVGFQGYSIEVGGATLDSGETLNERQDVHSFYMRTLSEQGIVGFALFIYLLFKSFRSGWKLSKFGTTSFQKSLGLGFIGCVTVIAIANLFGDRFSYFVLGSYFWILWGLVDRGLLNIKNSSVQPQTTI